MMMTMIMPFSSRVFLRRGALIYSSTGAYSASVHMIPFLLMIVSLGGAGAITFQSNSSTKDSWSVYSIVPLGIAEHCFIKQSNGHNCFAGASQVMAAVCGVKMEQSDCDRRTGFKGGVPECLNTLNRHFLASELGGVGASRQFDYVKEQIEAQKPVGMGIRKGKKNPHGHALAILAVAYGSGRLATYKSRGETKEAQFLGVIDPWGRTRAMSYDILDVDPDIERKIPAMGIHWIPFAAVRQGNLGTVLPLPSGWDNAEVQQFTIINGECNRMIPTEHCPKKEDIIDYTKELDTTAGCDSDGDSCGCGTCTPK
jgi:hypothetical protein